MDNKINRTLTLSVRVVYAYRPNGLNINSMYSQHTDSMELSRYGLALALKTLAVNLSRPSSRHRVVR